MQKQKATAEPLIQTILERAQRRIAARLPLTLSGVRGGGKAWLIASLAERISAPLVVLSESFERAEELYQDVVFFAGEGRAFFFPNWDTIPYDSFSPNQETIALRFRALAALLEGRCPILVTTPAAMMQGMIPPESFREYCFAVRRGATYPRRELVERLLGAGYIRVDLVEAPGEFSARGDIVDVYPIHLDHPVRLDFFDDELETLRAFDVATQKSFRELTELDLFPAGEGVVNAETTARAAKRLPDFKAGVQPETYRQIQSYLERGTPFPGVEQLLPILYDRVGRLHEVLSRDSLFLLDEPERLTRRSREFFDEVAGEFEFALRQGNLALPPEQFYLPPADLQNVVEGFYRADLVGLALEGGAETIPVGLTDNQTLRSLIAPDGQGAHLTLARIVDTLREWRAGGARIVLAVRSQTSGDRLRQLLAEFDLGTVLQTPDPELLRRLPFQESPAEGSDVTVLTGTPHHGFRFVDELGQTRFALITEEELLGEKTRQRRLKKSKLQHFVASLGELKEGELVVHVEYGIGRYEGLRRMQVAGEEGDFLVLRYAGDDKVYVPVARLNQVQKYTRLEGAGAVLNRLGDGAWQRSKQKAVRAVEDIAQDLVRVQAARKVRQGHAFDPNVALLTEFEETFPFQETEDQQRAIEEVLADMAAETPMDRLVCGDVGFGKTEVAKRAAYMAALDGKQVLVLVPTTILAQQHYETFRERFAEFPVRVDVLSRFRTSREQKNVVREFSEGKIDVLIGTHRLLSKDVQPKNLGLLVIDEEQRFGVVHKEKIKQFRTQVDVVTLSATPIPRTLHMALMGVRDLSIITTPPMDRIAIRTRLVKSSDYVIREAVEREIRRGGQVFVVHNKVETIHAFGAYLRDILPRTRLAIAHGQMGEKQLEEVMLNFVHGEVDLLLTTTIIESGLDIPRANTIIINGADHFGLAQLYQLRGRVGRSNVQAYAYLLVSPEKVLTEVAQKRLTLLQEFNDLGSGFRIASHDLEIRGAGNLLGREQSGHVNAVGLEFFTQMVEEAVATLQGEEARAPKPAECRLDLGFPYLLPESFIESTQQRLDTYKLLAEIKTEEEMWELRQTVEDRFGRFPREVANLFALVQIRLQASRYGLTALERAGGQLQAQVGHPERIDLERLMALVSRPELTLRIAPGDKLLFGPIPDTPEGVMERLRILEAVVQPLAA